MGRQGRGTGGVPPAMLMMWRGVYITNPAPRFRYLRIFQIYQNFSRIFRFASAVLKSTHEDQYDRTIHTLHKRRAMVDAPHLRKEQAPPMTDQEYGMIQDRWNWHRKVVHRWAPTKMSRNYAYSVRMLYQQ